MTQPTNDPRAMTELEQLVKVAVKEFWKSRFTIDDLEQMLLAFARQERQAGYEQGVREMTERVRARQKLLANDQARQERGA